MALANIAKNQILELLQAQRRKNDIWSIKEQFYGKKFLSHEITSGGP